MSALFDACLGGLEQAIDMRAKSGFEDSYFLLEAFRTDGAALQQVKQFKLNFEKSPNSSALPEEPNEIVGLLVHHLRVDDTCITCDDKGRAGLVSLGQAALQQAEEAIKQARSSKSMSEANGADELNTTEQLPNDSSSDEDENKVNDDDDDDDEEENEMQIQVEASKLLLPANLATAIRELSVENRARADRFVKLLHHCATHHPPPSSPPSEGQEDDFFFNLAMYFAPMLSKPANTAYLSIRHIREVPALRVVLWVWIQHYPEISALLASVEDDEEDVPQSPRVSRPVTTNSSAYNSPASSSLKTYPSGNGSNLKPRLSANSQEMKQKLAAKRGVAAASPLLVGKKKLSSSDIDTLVGKSMAIARFFNIENRLEAMAWLNQQAPPASVAKPASTASRWANEARLEIEKRVLKKRLLQWDREFETKHQRKPTKEDRLEVKGVFTAYAAVKILLNAVKDGDNDNLELLEKKALQAVLKLFERDFQEKMKRKVEFSTDIVGREMEYTRYKELKERHS